MWYFFIILTIFSASRVFGEDCYTHDFGETFNDVFTAESGSCGVMRPWLQVNYASTNIENFHPNGELFITPQTTYSCIFSEVFPMAGGGTLQLNVNMHPRSSTDEIRLLAYQSPSNTIVGQVTRSLARPDFIWGWNAMNLTLSGSDSFDGYVVIVGRKQSNSDAIVDSLRYIPASFETEDDEDQCPVYEEEEETSPACIEYNFERDYETLFNDLYIVCSEFSKWEIVNNVQGSFISPNIAGAFSCTSSLFFKIEDDGILELNIVAVPESITGFITFLISDEQGFPVNDINDNNFIPNDINDFVPGAHTLAIPITLHESKNIQIIFLGLAAEESTLLIDSFKFIPNSYVGGNCLQFEDVVNEY